MRRDFFPVYVFGDQIQIIYIVYRNLQSTDLGTIPRQNIPDTLNGRNGKFRIVFFQSCLIDSLDRKTSLELFSLPYKMEYQFIILL